MEPLSTMTMSSGTCTCVARLAAQRSVISGSLKFRMTARTEPSRRGTAATPASSVVPTIPRSSPVIARPLQTGISLHVPAATAPPRRAYRRSAAQLELPEARRNQAHAAVEFRTSPRREGPARCCTRAPMQQEAPDPEQRRREGPYPGHRRAVRPRVHGDHDGAAAEGDGARADHQEADLEPRRPDRRDDPRPEHDDQRHRCNERPKRRRAAGVLGIDRGDSADGRPVDRRGEPDQHHEEPAQPALVGDAHPQITPDERVDGIGERVEGEVGDPQDAGCERVLGEDVFRVLRGDGELVDREHEEQEGLAVNRTRPRRHVPPAPAARRRRWNRRRGGSPTSDATMPRR